MWEFSATYPVDCEGRGCESGFTVPAKIDSVSNSFYTEGMRKKWYLWCLLLIGLTLLSGCTERYVWTDKSSYGVHPYYEIRGDRYAYYEGQGGGNVELRSEGTVVFDEANGVALFTPEGSVTSSPLYYADGVLFGSASLANWEGTIPDGDRFDARLQFTPLNANGTAAYVTTLQFFANGSYTLDTVGGEGFSSLTEQEAGEYARDGCLLHLTGTAFDGSARTHTYALREGQLYSKVFIKQ